MMFRTEVLIPAFVCFLLSITVSAQTAEEPPLRILVPKSTSSIPLLVVEKLDESDDVVPGASIEVGFFSNHQQALALLLRGEVELLLTGTSMGWQNHLDGGPMMLVNTGIWGVSSLLTKDPSINGFEDLEGKTISVPFPGAPLDVQVRYILRSMGLSPDDDVSIQYLPFAQSIGGLMSGKVDASPLPEPIATDLVLNKGLKRVTEMRIAWGQARDDEPEAPEVSLFAHADRISTRGSEIDGVVAAWRDASEWIAAHPEQAGVEYADLLGRPAEVLAEAVNRTVFRIPSYEKNRTAVTDYFAIIRRNVGSITGSLNDSFFFHSP